MGDGNVALGSAVGAVGSLALQLSQLRLYGLLLVGFL